MDIKDKVKCAGKVTVTVRDENGNIVDWDVYYNVVTIAGRAKILEALTSPDVDIQVNKVALGSGTTAPSENDTTLETETYRNNIASSVWDDNVGYFTGHFTLTEVSGTFREIGLFIQGAGDPDTGTLLSHVAINKTKTTSQSLDVDWEITLSI